MNIFTDKVLRRSGSIDKICNIDPVGAALEAVRVMACVKRCVCKAPAKSSAVIPFSARYLAVVNAKQRGGKVWMRRCIEARFILVAEPVKSSPDLQRINFRRTPLCRQTAHRLRRAQLLHAYRAYQRNCAHTKSPEHIDL